MGKRVMVDGPGDDPDEFWFECDECEGTGKVSIPDPDEDPDEDANGNEVYHYYIEAICPVCNGLGFYEGDADDVDH